MVQTIYLTKQTVELHHGKSRIKFWTQIGIRSPDILDSAALIQILISQSWDSPDFMERATISFFKLLGSWAIWGHFESFLLINYLPHFSEQNLA